MGARSPRAAAAALPARARCAGAEGLTCTPYLAINGSSTVISSVLLPCLPLLRGGWCPTWSRGGMGGRRRRRQGECARRGAHRLEGVSHDREQYDMCASLPHHELPGRRGLGQPLLQLPQLLLPALLQDAAVVLGPAGGLEGGNEGVGVDEEELHQAPAKGLVVQPLAVPPRVAARQAGAQLRRRGGGGRAGVRRCTGAGKAAQWLKTSGACEPVVHEPWHM